ncbi:MAG: IclR family transcriptional regulator C-terminal domain-containing protein, partial [Burkholderiaceae bacterium]|nr:IclR family transcriptional regulator C-terminal domain-containing protein [Burkholderiaceae bacterium]
APRRRKIDSVAYAAGRLRPDAQRKGVASVETAVVILRILEFAASPLSLGHIARVAGFQASKTHHHLVSLVRTELAQQDAATGLYSLGPYARRLGKAARHKAQAAPVVSEAMQAFSQRTRQATMFTQWSRQGPVVTHWADGRRALSVNARIGALMPLWDSPTGDVFLAWLPDKALARVLRDGLPSGVTGRQIEALRARVRRDASSYAGGRRNASIAAVAAPVFEADGTLVGALTALGFEGDFDDSPNSSLSVDLRRAAAAVSAALGFGAARDAG